MFPGSNILLDTRNCVSLKGSYGFRVVWELWPLSLKDGQCSLRAQGLYLRVLEAVIPCGLGQSLASRVWYDK